MKRKELEELQKKQLLPYYKVRKKIPKKYKVALYCDEQIYNILYDFYKYYEIKNRAKIINFVANDFDVIMFNTNKKINMSVNSVTGIHGLTHVIIQKSFYKNNELERAISMLKTLRPEVEIIILIDVPMEYYALFLHRLNEKKLCHIATNPSHIDDILNGEEGIELSQYHLLKITKKHKKEYTQY